MKSPVSKAYRFENLISENNICQSWQAVDKITDTQVFVKVPSPTASLPHARLLPVLVNSFTLQRKLYSNRILKAARKRIDSGQLMIEYPFVDRQQWVELTPEILWSRPVDLLSKVAVAVDYVHLMQLVHGDLKLSNFLVRIDGTSSDVLLADMDLLRDAGKSTEAQIFGTPGHIAPEVIDNERVHIQSDNYSLGRSIELCLSTAPGDVRTKLAPLIDELTQADHLRRPRVLVNALRRHTLISDTEHRDVVSDLFAMTMITRFRQSRRSELGNAQKMDRLLRGQAKIMGLQDDLVNDFAAAYTRNRRLTVRTFRALVRKSQLSVYSDSWQFVTNDESLTEGYSVLQEYADSPDRERKAAAGGSLFDCDASPAAFKKIVTGLVEAGYREKPYLALKKYSRSRIADRDFVRRYPHFWHQMATLAKSLRRMSEAEDHYRVLLDAAESDEQKLAAYMKLISVAVDRRNVARVEELIQQATQIPDTKNTAGMRRELRRQQAWLQYVTGNGRLAIETLESLVEDCRSAGDYEALALATYNLGVVETVIRGDRLRSEQLILQSLTIAREHGIQHHLVRAATTLSMVYTTLSRYEQAIRYGKEAFKSAHEPEQEPLLPVVAASLSTALVRVAEFDKAEHWLQRHVSLIQREADVSKLSHLYRLTGYVARISGRLTEARETLERVVELSNQAKIPTSDTDSARSGLAQIALWQARLDAVHSHCRQVKELYDPAVNKSDFAAADLIDKLADVVYRNGRAAELLVPLLDDLESGGRNYAAVEVIFHLLLDGDPIVVEQAEEFARPLYDVLAKSTVPLFVAVDSLLDGYRSSSREQVKRYLDVRTWKKALTAFSKGRLKFEAMLTARKIALEYEKSDKPLLARRFYEQVKKHAEALDNKFFASEAESRLDLLARAGVGSGRFLSYVHEVSILLKDLTDYEATLQRLIRLAVDLSGAERGVLLLRADGASRLYVAASINCDDQSLSDITDFSMSVPAVTLEELEPLIIENAITDTRTRQYKSVAVHNIMSVVCLPLVDGDQPLGVLYLDHHSIPALFSLEDITFIRSVANFITVSLRMALKYRTMDLRNLELRSQLQQAGVEGEFITANPAMMDLIRSLKNTIARTNSPVLILGESGTGKELLANLVQRHSQRAEKPYVKLNCAAVSKDLIEAELFGIKERVATGVDGREGKFGVANGGTLFLDEIGDMPLELQSRLLRVIEQKEFEKVGTSRPIYADIRYIYATNKNLAKLLETGRFREDLYFRIAPIEVHVTPLRERPEDIPLLVIHFLKVFHSRAGDIPSVTGSAMQALCEYSWPGNVREVRNFAERMSLLHAGKKIGLGDLPSVMVDPKNKINGPRQSVVSTKSLRKAAKTRKPSKEALLDMLIRHNWNRSAVSRELGVPISTLRRLILKYRLKPPRTP